MKIFNLFLTLLFALFAIVQLNDPDPGFWIFLYGTTALYSAGSARDVLPRGVGIGWGVLTACMATWMLATWDGSSRPMGSTAWGPLSDEVVREMLGLLMVSAWSGFLAWRAVPRKS